jgi:hypothetical protein
VYLVCDLRDYSNMLYANGVLHLRRLLAKPRYAVLPLESSDRIQGIGMVYWS